MSVYIHGGLRSPIGVLNGQYKNTRPEILGAQLIDELIKRYKIGSVDGVFCGNAVGTGGNIGRLMSLMSDLTVSTPAVTVDMQCASALMSIEMAYTHIASGVMDSAIAGGIESSSLQPDRIYAAGDDREGLYKVAQFSPQDCSPLAMLEGAERTIQKHNVLKEDLYPYIIGSHQRAIEALDNQYLQSYIMPFTIDGKDCIDECIRPKINEKLLSRMKPLLGKDSITNASNACLTQDGAAFVYISNEKGPFRIHSVMPCAGNPQFSPEGALESTKAILKRTGLSMDDIDVVEWNEAFAIIDVLFNKAYPNHMGKYNMLGGALAYGHPYGCSGAILALHCMAALESCNGRYGLCAIAGAGGTGTALIMERM
ncbi:MAG: thiolase family protein [Veillonella sp.]|uniref:thiolase family protein n=1 Tax=Veillonella sp. TaxID=1926307 RepID=UPI0007675846|nr:thiolase family protein [Veillonella sp.]MDU2165906.1 thiolase family protein [Veillonella sp.]MDU2903473.1 thiolase family protein [Veillonella sp.]MDU2930846.1 thiolase family protein [Veillonella sp.]MDU2965217.1 thiolase family protein [Veillonella sp.]MDU6816024.1 thiolase family protein [Veillonella sp.]